LYRSCKITGSTRPRNILMWFEATRSATNSTVRFRDAGWLWKKFSSSWCYKIHNIIVNKRKPCKFRHRKFICTAYVYHL
jgi:hypothetical protein